MCVTCGGGHNGGGQSIDGGVGSREAPGVEAAHGGDVGGGGVGGDAGQLKSGLSADQAGGEGCKAESKAGYCLAITRLGYTNRVSVYTALQCLY